MSAGRQDEERNGAGHFCGHRRRFQRHAAEDRRPGTGRLHQEPVPATGAGPSGSRGLSHRFPQRRSDSEGRGRLRRVPRSHRQVEGALDPRHRHQRHAGSHQRRRAGAACVQPHRYPPGADYRRGGGAAGSTRRIPQVERPRQDRARHRHRRRQRGIRHHRPRLHRLLQQPAPGGGEDVRDVPSERTRLRHSGAAGAGLHGPVGGGHPERGERARDRPDRLHRRQRGRPRRPYRHRLQTRGRGHSERRAVHSAPQPPDHAQGNSPG